MATSRSLDTFLDLYRDAIWETLNSGKYEFDYDEIKTCLNRDLSDAINKTSHVVKATTVAWGAGFCIYAARLMTAIGARRITISENIPGKGSNVHKVLSIASLDYLNSWKNGQGVGEKALKSIVEKSIKELDDLIQVRNGNEIEEIKNKVINMLENLINILPDALRSLGINHKLYNDLRFYTELELVDYKIHVWGVPDLIIEHPGERKAIVIEWKSDEEAPRETEKYQAYIYAMLEAIRLGYGETFNDIVNAIAPDNIGDTKVLPIIIRPNYAYSDHPLFPISGRQNTKSASIEELRDRLRRIVITSTYLTLLLMDVDSLLYGDEKHRNKNVITTRNVCVVKRSDRNGNPSYVLRMTPTTLLMGGGYPMSQNRYPCTVCPFSDAKSALKECSFYFGSFEKDKLDKLMWLYRFKVYRERERDLVMYKALYLASELRNLRLHDFKEKMGTQFCGLKLDLSSLRPYKHPCSRDTKSSCGTFEVSFKEIDTREVARIGVYEIEKEHNDEYYDDIIILRRRLMCCEGSSKDEIPKVALPRIRQPVLVTLIEDHVTYPTLGTSLFGRVERALSLGEEDEDLSLKCGSDEACIVITPISPYLRLPFRLFKRYVKMYGITNALVTEVGADLTNMDLATLHALHMSLKSAEAKEELNDLSENDREMLFKTVEEALNEAFSTYTSG